MQSEFPALIPTAAPITPGTWASSSIQSLSGGRTVTRVSSAEVGRRLSLTFSNITEEHFLWIRNHYRGHRSRFDLFTFNAATLPVAQSPAGQLWRWASPPRVTDEHVNVFTVVCEFIAQPRQLLQMRAAAWRTGETTLTRGAMTGVTERFGTGIEWVTSSTTLTPGAASTAADPPFSSVSLLLHMDGSDGSTTFTDSSSAALTVTANGNAQISTAQSKFGGASGLFDGNGDYLDVPSSADFNFGTGDFTVEFWYWCASAPTSSPFRRIIAHPASNNAANTFQIWHAGTDGSGATVDAVELAVPGGTGVVVSTKTAVSDSTWHHIAFCRSSGTSRCFLDGVLKATASDSNSYTRGGTEGLRIGARGDLAASTFLNGYIDDLRITKAARYTTNYNLPEAAFPDA
jgi:hypothetical protein